MKDLTKWPRLIVVGDPVTPEQANDILMRTNSWYWFGCNDRAWEADVRRITGLPEDFNGPIEGFNAHWARMTAFMTSINALELEYLHNDRIASSYLGGPHGWCDWDGTIGCANYNIGKWPSVEDVRDEWRRIAEAWPFLRLRTQLIPDEGDAGRSVVRFEVADGAVEVHEVAEAVMEFVVDFEPMALLASILAPGAERGVEPGRLTAATRQVRAAA